VAVPVSSTTTQTTTSLLTVTGTGATTLYQTFPQVTSVPTTTGTTYTTTGIVPVPVQVVTVVISPVTSTLYWGEEGCQPPPCAGPCCTTVHSTMTNVYFVTKTGVVVVMSPSQVRSFVTSQYLTNVPTTVFSTSTSISTHATGQVISITNTQTFTSVSEVQPPAPSISEILSQNLLIILVLVAVGIGVLGFRLGRRGGRGPSKVSASGGFCSSCGFRLTLDSQFCPKCGTRRTDA
jgi:hypothetical protein